MMEFDWLHLVLSLLLLAAGTVVIYLLRLDFKDGKLIRKARTQFIREVKETIEWYRQKFDEQTAVHNEIVLDAERDTKKMEERIALLMEKAERLRSINVELRAELMGFHCHKLDKVMSRLNAASEDLERYIERNGILFDQVLQGDEEIRRLRECHKFGCIDKEYKMLRAKVEEYRPGFMKELIEKFPELQSKKHAGKRAEGEKGGEALLKERMVQHCILLKLRFNKKQIADIFGIDLKNIYHARLELKKLLLAELKKTTPELEIGDLDLEDFFYKF